MSVNHWTKCLFLDCFHSHMEKMTYIGSKFPTGKKAPQSESQYAKCLRIVWHITQDFHILSSHSLFLNIWAIPFWSREIFWLICTGAPHGWPSVWVSFESLIRAEIDLKSSQIASNNDLQTCHGWLLGSSWEFNLL